MITPFTEDGTIDEPAVLRLLAWYEQQGCNGVFAVCQSSEMFFLSLEERVHLARLCVEHAGGLEVIASGHVSDTPEAQFREVQAIWDTGVKAVVLVTNRFAAQDEDDDIWIERASALLKAVPDATFGIYECPYPYKRLITEKTLSWMISTGRFTFIKDTCCQEAMIRERLKLIEAMTPSGSHPIQLYNANTMTLLASLRDGAAGFCGVMGNFHPFVYSWFYRFYAQEPEKAERVQSMLTLLSLLESFCYPVCAKKHFQDLGIPMSLRTRSKDPSLFGYTEQEVLRQAEIAEKAVAQYCFMREGAWSEWESSENSLLVTLEAAQGTPKTPTGMKTSIPYRGTEDFPFLHDTMVSILGERLLCAWYACSENEIVGKTLIRGMWSKDHGETWGPIETIAEAEPGSGLHMVPAVFYEDHGQILALVTTMSAHDRPTGYVCLEYIDGKWTRLYEKQDLVLFNTNPVALPDGTWISAGRMSSHIGGLPLIPVVMKTRPEHPMDWEIIPLSGPWNYNVFPLDFPETTILPGGSRLTAITRNDHGKAQVFESYDFGRTWSSPVNSQLPIGASKLCGGQLSDGRQYLIYNERIPAGGRERLVIALRSDSDHAFEHVLTLRCGQDAELSGGPWWHYPCACEQDGYLFVSCTSSAPGVIRRSAGFMRIPISSL